MFVCLSVCFWHFVWAHLSATVPSADVADRCVCMSESIVTAVTSKINLFSFESSLLFLMLEAPDNKKTTRLVKRKQICCYIEAGKSSERASRFPVPHILTLCTRGWLSAPLGFMCLFGCWKWHVDAAQLKIWRNAKTSLSLWTFVAVRKESWHENPNTLSMCPLQQKAAEPALYPGDSRTNDHYKRLLAPSHDPFDSFTSWRNILKRFVLYLLSLPDVSLWSFLLFSPHAAID